MVDGVGHRRRTPVSEQVSGLEGACIPEGPIQKPLFLESFSPAGQRELGKQQPEQARGKKKLRVNVYLSRFLRGIKTELMCSDCTRPWDDRSGQRREKFLPCLVLGVQRAKKAVSGYAAHHQYGGW